jgi:hypothetical protein
MLGEGFVREPFEGLPRPLEGGVEAFLGLDLCENRHGEVVLSGIGKV